MENIDQSVSANSDSNDCSSKEPTKFKARPEETIFNGRFISEQLIYADDSQHRYIVRQIADDDQRFRVCPNRNCGAVQPPATEMAEYCTACGNALGSAEPELELVESLSPIYATLTKVAEKHLSHGSVRSPVASFSEFFDSEERFCLVRPKTNGLDFHPQPQQVLEWGIGLAYGLDYLHANGITFNGKVEPSRIGLEGNKAVWCDFEDCHVNSTALDQEKKDDIDALLELLYFWLTGKLEFEEDSILPPPLSPVFRQGMKPGGFSTAAELGQALEQIITEMSTPSVVDYLSGHRSDVGIVRSLNEDSLLLIETSRIIQSVCLPIGVYLIADGMGGHTAGEIASMTIVNSVAKNAYSELLIKNLNSFADIDYNVWLHNAIYAANQTVYELRKATASDLGSTVVAALIENNKAYIVNVGDSRAYLIKEGKIRQITTDHTLVERMVATGQISAEEARYHPQRNVIYRTIGEKARVKIDTYDLSLDPGDRLLLCSDGLSGMIDDKEIFHIVEQASSPQSACDELIVAANEAGGFDNISVIVVEAILSKKSLGENSGYDKVDHQH